MARDGRTLGERGVALTEYALALGVIVVGSLGVIQTMEDNTSDEVDNQAECISERPPPPGCQLAPLTPTTSTTTPPSGTTPPGSPDNPIPATIQVDSVTAIPGTPAWSVTADVLVEDDVSVPIVNETVGVKVAITQSTVPAFVGRFFFVECVTDSSGVCHLSFSSRWPGVTRLEFDVVSLGTESIYSYDDLDSILVDAP